MSEPKPIKRSKQLAPLSREHHDTLQFTWKLKQGLSNGTPVEEMVAYARWYWNNFLQQHFIEEEDILLADIPSTDKLTEQLIMEHKKIKELITGNLEINTITLLTDTINSHIRFEERQLFPYVEQKLNPEQLENIHTQLNQVSQCHEKWDNEFWIRKK